MTSTTHQHHHEEDVPEAVHAMVLFGDKNLYLSHMPLFSPPHNDQVILEVSLAKKGEKPDDRYRDDRKSSGTPFYTVKPPEMHLAVLEPGASFVGDVHRNSYEDDGELLVSGVTVTVEKVVYTQKLDPKTDPHTDGRHYLCFGRPGEFFAAHEISSAPSFDQIIPITISGEEAAAHVAGLPASPMTLPGTDDADSRLHDGEKAEATFVVKPRSAHDLTASITAADEIFFDDRFLEG